MRILLSGYNGFMGREVVSLADKGIYGAVIAAGVDINISGDEKVNCTSTFENAETAVDCIIDFSHHSLTKELCDFAVVNNIPLVLATTGQTDEERAYIAEASKSIPLFFATNYSLGVALLIDTAKRIARSMPGADIEIIEYHHNRKIDAPSGTALSIFEALKEVREEAVPSYNRHESGKRTPEEIGIHSVRMGNICGIHEVMIGTQSQTITLKHEAHNRAVFAEGALAAADFLKDKEAGLYGINDILNSSEG